MDIAAATLNAVKGRTMRIDLCSVTQKDKRIIAFLSQTAGLMVDLVVETEYIRWLGSSRLILGYIRRRVLFVVNRKLRF
jgi:sphingosine kinase